MKTGIHLCLAALWATATGYAQSVALVPGSPLRLDLEGAASITGILLKHSAEAWWVDIGHEVLRVPVEKVRQALSLESNGGNDAPEGPGLRRDEGRLFVERTQTKSLPVEDWVRRLGEGVVEIRSRAGQGSGFLINDEGHVITNYHVIAQDRELTVTVFSGADGDLERIQYRNIRIVAMNPDHDLALLAIDDPPRRPFRPLPLGDSNRVPTGSHVFAIGSPLGLDRTVSRGIVSLADRYMGGSLYLQTTAQINPGNSGGPLLNLAGEVVGVNTLKFMSTGIEGVAFAVPSDTVKTFLAKRGAYAFDPRNPNTGYHYLNPPRKHSAPIPIPLENTP